ncbi:fasciclin domain-containing protein [Lewinella sp. JB7]|uniref:fasciclin domain-containing protein n=1 Tax=Lewinella sp. JB7 TaxID=2962887 RepID=UPI0020C9DA82|nr:fasciclin domain-containing protein [Lewinella sp. JB7]MCP9237610.1 fasciclin domain-containing protein [Lewinella sp. JB7]
MKTLIFNLMALFAVMAFTSTTALAQATEQEENNIVVLASENNDLTTLVAALKAADLVSTLEGEGPFTVFAPTDDAFRALPPEVFSALLKAENRQALVDILKYHVADGKVAAADVTQGIENATDDTPFMASTMNGDFSASLMDGSVELRDAQGNTAMVTQADVMASNGVIHLIDHVLIPANVDVDALMHGGMDHEKKMDDRMGAMNEEADDMMEEGEEMGDEMLDSTQSMAAEMKGEAREMGNEMREGAREMGNEMREGAREMGNELEEEGQEVANEIERAGEETSQAVQRTTTEVGNDVRREMNTTTDRMSNTTRRGTSNNSIVDVAGQNEDFSTLMSAVETAELSDVLGSESEFTVFAPTNEAFNKLSQGENGSALNSGDKEQLRGILSYHVVASRITAEDLQKAIKANKGYFRIQTIDGNSLIASMKDGQVILTDGNGEMATITSTDVAASNGLIHVIDTVLTPKQ